MLDSCGSDLPPGYLAGPSGGPERRGAPAPRRIILTGHPPIEEQLRHQLRSSTGARYMKPRPARVATADPQPAGAAPATASQPVEPPAERMVPPTYARRLLDVLQRLAQVGHPLPAITDLAARVSCSSPTIYAALDKLTSDGAIAMWVGSTNAWRGERVIRLRGHDVLLRTIGAPLHIDPAFIRTP